MLPSDMESCFMYMATIVPLKRSVPNALKSQKARVPHVGVVIRRARGEEGNGRLSSSCKCLLSFHAISNEEISLS